VTPDPVWEQGGWDPLSALVGEFEAEVCVVGLGGSGLSAVQRALALGVSVIGIDAGIVAGSAAGRNGGFLLAGSAAFYHLARQQLGAERARALYAATIDQIQQMAEETPALVRLVGSLRIALDAAEYDDCLAQHAAMREDGLPVERYAGDEGRGLYFPTDGAFNPLARARELAKRALAGGAQLFERSPATVIASGRVTTPGGVVRAKRIIVAVDGRLEHLLPQLAGRVRSARLQMLASAPTREVCFPRPVYANYGYLYWQQLPSGEVALGGFRDAFREAEWTIEDTPSDAVQARLERFLCEHLGVQAPVTHRWAASVGYTGGILPIFAEVLPGVWAVGGYNGTGNVIGALCGQAAVAQAVTGSSSLARLFSG
jgi:glycine/D-amino acid oxidase-like deaminating enzyme